MAVMEQCIDKDRGWSVTNRTQFWVYSALNFTTGPTFVKDYFKVGATSLKSGSETVNTVRSFINLES